MKKASRRVTQRIIFPVRRPDCSLVLSALLLTGCVHTPFMLDEQSPYSTPNSAEQWRADPQDALSTLKARITESLEAGEIKRAQQDVLQSLAAANYYLTQPYLTPPGPSQHTTAPEAPEALSAAPITAAATPNQTPNNSGNTTSQNSPIWPEIKRSIQALADDIDAYLSQTEQALSHRARFDRAAWLQSEIQRLQWRINQGGFRPFTALALKQRQQEVQTRLDEALSDAIAHIKNGNKQGLADLAPLISLLKGEPKASNRKTDQKLLAEGFAPILANQHLEKMLRQVEEYFTDALTHENAAVKSNSADTSQTNPSALKSTAQLHRAKRGYEKPPWKALSIALDKAIRESDLLNIQNLIQQLRAQPSLPLAQRVRAEAIESFLEQQIQSMNTQADALYQQGHIQDAKHLWEMLLTLSPTNEQLSAKVNRAEKVLDNLEALREQTPIPAQESTPYFSEIPDSKTSAP